MPDREKVIRGMEIARKGKCPLVDRDGSCQIGCPYAIGKCEEMLADAISQLKEQEPRVLTLAEAAEADVCWLEIKGSGRILPCMVQDEEENFSIRTDEPTPELGPGDENGKEYRLWSARPTDAQREAVKWEK